MARFEDHQRIALENVALLLERPEIALDAITKEQSTFTYQDLARFINRHTENLEQFNLVFEKLKSSQELVFLGCDSKSQQRFSTKDMLNLEASMMRAAESLDKRLNHEVSDKVILGVLFGGFVVHRFTPEINDRINKTMLSQLSAGEKLMRSWPKLSKE